MKTLGAFIDGVGLIGPGINGWPDGSAVLRGEVNYLAQTTQYPQPMLLPPTERRRTGAVVKLALAIGREAIEAADITPEHLATVFASSGGDTLNCHLLCETLASADRHISPTRFHNSVTNAPAGYWSIATGSMAPSTVLCGYDASFGAGLLDALTQVATNGKTCALIAYDLNYPEPLHSSRLIPDGFGVALVFSAQRSHRSVARIEAGFTHDAPSSLADSALEQLRTTIPAARSLPLLRMLAHHQVGSVVIDYLAPLRIKVDLNPCN